MIIPKTFLFKARSWKAPFYLFCAAFILRFMLISKGLYHPDAILLFNQAEKTLTTGHLQPYLTGYNLPVILGAFFIWIFGKIGILNPIGALNFLSVFFGAMSIPVFYLFCRKIFDERTAFFSSVALLAFPLHLSLSTWGSSYMPAFFFLLLGFKFLSDYQEDSLKPLIGAAISFGLLGASRPQELVFMAIPITYYWFRIMPQIKMRGNADTVRSKYIGFFCFWGVISAVIVLVPLPFLDRSNNKSILDAFQNLYIVYFTPTKHMLRVLIEVYKYSFKVIFRELSCIGLFFSLLGYIFIGRRNLRLFVFILLWFLCPFIFYTAFMSKVMPTERYLLIAFPPLILALGHVVACYAEIYKKKFSKVMICLFLGVQILFLMKIIPTLLWRHNYDANSDHARSVAARTEQDALIISTDDTAFIRQYGQRRAIAMYPPEIDKNFAQIEKEIEQGQSVYFLIPHCIATDYNFLFEKEKYSFYFRGYSNFEYWQRTTTKMNLSPIGLFKMELKDED